MPTGKTIGFLIFMQPALLLAISFFVLFAVTKVNAGKLKTFGYAVAIFLWIAASFSSPDDQKT